MPRNNQKKKKALEEKLRKEQEALEKRIELYRQAKKLNYIRLALLKETYKIFDGNSRGMAKIFAVKEQTNSWNRYISCTKFPFAHQPTALRTFLSTWKIQIQKDLGKYFDWMLSVDERTMLSQNIDRIDLTFDSLRTRQPNFAEPFAKGANDAITVLTDIEDVLNRPEHYQCTEKSIEELLQIKDDFRSYLWSTLDIMTYTTIGNIERDMNAIDATSSAYQFKSNVFAIGLYSNREVPLPRMEDRPDVLSIRFDSISASLKCPKHITFDESALRGLWFSYDHYSDQARSYKIPNYSPSVENLLESCRIETEDKERLENDNIERMKRDRAKYEETIVDEKPQSNEEEKKPKPKPKPKRGRGAIAVKIVEPPKVDEDTVVDVTAEYMELENLRNKERLNLLHPDEIQLQPNELNLRQYTILGGTYAIHYLEKPGQSVKFDNHMFLTNIEKPVALKYRPYKQSYRPVEFPSDCVLSALDQEDIKRKDVVRFNQLIELSVQLTSDIFWWEEPVVCRWQPWEESEDFMKLPDDLRDYNLNYDQITKTKSSRLWNSIPNEKVACEPEILEDFDLNGSRSDVHLDYLIRKHLLPRLSVTYRFESELKEVEDKLAAELKRRMHLQFEHEEDLRLEAIERAEAKKIKDEQRAARRAERAAHILEQQENEEEIVDEESFTSSSSSSSEAALVGENVTADSDPNGLITFKSVVEGTAARELFPFLEKCTELKVMRPIRSEFRWSLLNADLKTNPDIDLLSGLLERIQQYNFKELPQFTDEASAMTGFHTKKNVIPTIAIKRKGKRGTVVAQQSTVKNQCQELKLIPHNKGNWITSGIFLQNFDPVERIITFKTSEIGVFGFAVGKYYQFPISYWDASPNLEKSMTTLIVVEGRTVSIEILVTISGYRLTITKPIPKKCPIKVPTNTMSLKQLIQFLRDHNMNFFPEPDAFWYINGMTNVKQDAMCNHAYLCMGHFCLTHQFRRSAWNVLANCREAIILSRQIIENRAPEPFAEVKITPHDSYFVRVEELCTSLDEVSLFYHLAPPDQEFNCDMISLLTAQSVEKSKNKQQNTSIRLKSNVSELLMALQLLSYST